MNIEKDKIGIFLNKDCMDYLPTMSDNSVNLTLTDIPYGVVNRDGGFRNLNKGKADIETFSLQDFLPEVYRVSSTVIIFCGKEQISEIYTFFDNKQKEHKGTVRQIVWRKTNPSPMNGQYIYLSGIENAVWFKKRGGTSMPIARIPCLIIHVAEAKYIQQKRTMDC